MQLSTQRLTELARFGAEAELARIARARQDILALFPDLAAPATTSVDRAVAQAMAPKRRHMTAAQRKVVSQRMTAYWAARRREKRSAAKGASAR